MEAHAMASVTEPDKRFARSSAAGCAGSRVSRVQESAAVLRITGICIAPARRIIALAVEGWCRDAHSATVASDRCRANLGDVS